jgi:Na+/phosphate symporter
MKITINELRNVIKRIIREETSFINENKKIDKLEDLIDNYKSAEKKYKSARVNDDYSTEEVHKLSATALALKKEIIKYNTFIDKKELTDTEATKLKKLIAYIKTLESKAPRDYRDMD